jgi:hypothetical protein
LCDNCVIIQQNTKVKSKTSKNASWRDFQSVFSVIRRTKISAFSGICFGICFVL